MNEVIDFLRRLDNAPKSRRQWKLLDVYCKRCSHLMVEVFLTPDDFARLVALYVGLRPGGRILGITDKGIRAPNPHVTVLLTENQDPLHVVCKCGKRELAPALLLGAVRANTRKLVLDAPTSQTLPDTDMDK